MYLPLSSREHLGLLPNTWGIYFLQIPPASKLVLRDHHFATSLEFVEQQPTSMVGYMQHQSGMPSKAIDIRSSITKRTDKLFNSQLNVKHDTY